MTRNALPIVVFAALVIGAGVVQGLQSDRWRRSSDVDQAVQRLQKVPTSLGDWQGEPQAIEEEDLRRAGIQGHAYYRYRNAVTGDVVNMLIVCGRPGPISVHTPDVCYSGAGYEATGKQFTKEVPVEGDRTISVWGLRFKAPTTAGASQIEVDWAWNAGNGWVAADVARWKFSGQKALYKLYVVRTLPALAADKKKDPSVSFLQTFLPELEKVLAR
jgi:hypothetical protein